jgi:hypothetical protein
VTVVVNQVEGPKACFEFSDIAGITVSFLALQERTAGSESRLFVALFEQRQDQQ